MRAVVKPSILRAQVEGEPALVLTVGEINALTRRGVWSRLGFSGLVAAIACSVISWQTVGAWLCVVLLWELVVRRRLERWTSPISADDRSEHSLRKLAAVHAFGAAIYAAMGALGFLSLTALGAQVAMGWIAGAAIHAFVYFSNRRTLLLANLSAPILVALVAPTIAAGGVTAHAALSTIVTLTLLASAALFAADRNVLLGHLASQIGARRAAEDASEAKTLFLKTISRELRTPLNTVIGYSELLVEELADIGADQHRADASHISAAGRHMMTLIDDIVQVAQQKANAPLLVLDEIDTSALLHEIEDLARGRAAERGNRFALEVNPLPRIALDRAKLTAALSELISNACKFTNDGLITLRVWSEGERIVFEVTDTGVGMSPETRAQLFAPPAHADETTRHNSDGAGLGLATARKNARLMGGDIAVESEVGHGATFTLWLPISHNARTPLGPQAAQDPHAQSVLA